LVTRLIVGTRLVAVVLSVLIDTLVVVKLVVYVAIVV
jgi:hypothetical protein